MKILANNKKAVFNYEVLKKFEAGIVLEGWEVKSIKTGRVSLKESYVKIMQGVPIIEKMHISEWPGMQKENDPNLDRDRILLLHQKEINNLITGTKIKGQTIVPLQLFLDKNKIKLEIALARGKKKFDKRAKLKEKDQIRQIDRDLKYLGYN
jgi:SsrA-binding protein